jgi:hypothetical protein
MIDIDDPQKLEQAEILFNALVQYRTRHGQPSAHLSVDEALAEIDKLADDQEFLAELGKAWSRAVMESRNRILN